MKSGKLPFTLSADGKRQIDPAELQRVFPGDHGAKPKKKKTPYHYAPARVADAAALQQRIAEGQATADEAREYQRIIKEFRRKFHGGQLSPETARRFGIE